MRDITIQSSRQVQDFVLCRDCEQRFSRNGEEYMAGLVYNGATFPLQYRLNLALPVSAYRIGNAQAFSGPDAGIDTGKMAYFALSIIWRSAVHKWHISSRATTTLSLGAHEEQIRKYLLGEASFPPDVAVMATVSGGVLRSGCCEE